jgi:hypothetical protein
MRIFATKQIECGGQVRLFKVNLHATALFTDANGIKLNDIGERLGNPSLMELMDFAYYAYLVTGEKVERDVFMSWYDHSNLLFEFNELLADALNSGETSVGKPKAKR